MDDDAGDGGEYVNVSRDKLLKLIRDFDMLLKNMEEGIVKGRVDVLKKVLLRDIDRVLNDLEGLSNSEDIEGVCKELMLKRKDRFRKILCK